MNDRLILAARCALADLVGLWLADCVGSAGARTIVELYEALEDVGQDVSDYRAEYERIKHGERDTNGQEA